MVRATWQWVKTGRVISGGSTITMQLARLLEPRPRTVQSKWIEIVRSFELELKKTKNEILDAYMTLVPMGGNLESVRAASYRYFGKEPRTLSLAEVSLLIALPQSPELRRPDRQLKNATQAAEHIGTKLIYAGIFPSQDIDEFSLDAFDTLHIFPNHAWHIAVEAVRADKKKQSHTHQTTIDYRLQRQVAAKVGSSTLQLERESNIAVVIAEASTGNILAYLGSSGLDSSSGFMDLARAIRSPGSAMKPFIYGLAIDDRLIDDQTILFDVPSNFSGYSPANFDSGYRGPVRMGVALQQSLNVPAVGVLNELGPDLFLKEWSNAGLLYRLPKNAQPNIAIALGAMGTRLIDLVSAYTSLASAGKVTTLKSLPKTVPIDDAVQLLTPETSRLIFKILASSDTVDGRLNSNSSHFQGAFKTGTSYGYRDAWAIGVTGDFVIGVWMGRPDGGPVKGMTGRSSALRLAYELSDQLNVTPNSQNWLAAPITPADGLIVPAQVLKPVHGSQLLLKALPASHREVSLELVGNVEKSVISVNGIETSNFHSVSVPNDGTYIVQLKQGGKLTQQVIFSVMTLRSN
jgi:penicillin-binding protein 1C